MQNLYYIDGFASLCKVLTHFSIQENAMCAEKLLLNTQVNEDFAY